MALHRRLRPYRIHILIGLIFAFILEPLYHVRNTYPITRPSKSLDLPFHEACVDPVAENATTTRQNAAIVMLARNSDVEGAAIAIQSLESRFNQWFGYPYVFLNDKPWDNNFEKKIRCLLYTSPSPRD